MLAMIFLCFSRKGKVIARFLNEYTATTELRQAFSIYLSVPAFPIYLSVL